MEIKIDTEIRNKYHIGFNRDKLDVNQIVIHGTGGGSSAQSIMRWMLGGERASQYKKGIGLFHYLIDCFGVIYEIISPKNWVYHSSSGRHDKHTIGIELINLNFSNQSEYTPNQYFSFIDLIFNKIFKMYNITSIIGHGTCKKIYSKSYKNCPGNFNWKIIKDELTERNFIFERGGEYIYNILK